ncbi:hypothetical protein GF325_08805 [Candidatus Bathyarchaeota archaeon]|nr:hypothetical protein [Candidatus Bathyarchaeota archaeon]
MNQQSSGASRKSSILLQVSNLIAVFAMIIINILANALPFNGKGTGELADNISNLFVPAGIIFSIWGVIYLTQALFAFYQLGGIAGKWEEEPEYFNQVGVFNLIASAANITWIFLWHWEKVPLSLIPMIVLFLSLLAIYLRLDIGKAGENASRKEKIFVQVPFSIYLGWITVATIANVTAVLVVTGWSGWGIPESTWSVLVIIVATIITALMLLTRRDIVYSLVILWATFGIWLKQGSGYPDIAITTIISLIIVAALAVFTAIRKYKS